MLGEVGYVDGEVVELLGGCVGHVGWSGWDMLGEWWDMLG